MGTERPVDSGLLHNEILRHIVSTATMIFNIHRILFYSYALKSHQPNVVCQNS